MTRIAIAAALTVSALFVPIAAAAADHGRGHDKWRQADAGHDARLYGVPPGQAKKLWRRGEHLPPAYRATRFVIVDPHAYHLTPPRRGFRWVLVDGDAYLIGVTTGVILEHVTGAVAVRGPAPYPVARREDLWRKRYARTFTVEDDSFYRDCRRSVNPVGVISGAAIGGLLGNAAGQGNGKTGATVAGVILGGAIGAALTSDLDCDDRGYAYKTYHEGLNAGRPNRVYRWVNPGSGRQGEFSVAAYYDDPDGFRCARYTQKIFVDGLPEASAGVACQQPDGTWTIVR